MMRRKIQRMAHGYRSKRKLVFKWDGPYHPMADFLAYRAASYWTWNHPTKAIPLIEMQHIKAFARLLSKPI